MSTQLSNNFQANSPKALDNRTGKFVSGEWLPYDSVLEANASPNNLPVFRYVGLTLLINVGGVPTEYWYRDGTTDSDLIVKSEGGQGGAGMNGWTPVPAVVADGEREVLKVVDWTGGTGTKPAANKFIGPEGFVNTAAEATDIRGAAGQDGQDGTPADLDAYFSERPVYSSAADAFTELGAGKVFRFPNGTFALTVAVDSFTPLGVTLEDAQKNYLVISAAEGIPSQPTPSASDFSLTGITNTYVQGEILAPLTQDTEVTLWTNGPDVPPYGDSPVRAPRKVALPDPSDTPVSGSATQLNIINFNKLSRIRQEGNLIKIKLVLASLPADVTSFKFQIWRGASNADLGTVKLIAEQELIGHGLGSGLSTVTLPTPISIEINDLTAVSYTRSAGGSDFIILNSIANESPIYFQDGAYYKADGSNFASPQSFPQTPQNPQYAGYVPILCIVDKAPVCVFLGDSWFEGYPVSFNFIKDNPLFLNNFALPEQFASRSGMTIQNYGWSAESSTYILQRLTQALAAKPRYLVTLFTINGVDPAHYVSMAQQCQTVGVKMFCFSFGPASDYVVEFSNIWDAAVPQLEALGVICIDGRALIGVETATGSRVWRLKPEYKEDDRHPNAAANAVYMGLLIDAMRSMTTTLISGNKLLLRLNRSATASDEGSLTYAQGSVVVSDSEGAVMDAFNQAVQNNIQPGREPVQFIPGTWTYYADKVIGAGDDGYVEFAFDGQNGPALSLDVNTDVANNYTTTPNYGKAGAFGGGGAVQVIHDGQYNSAGGSLSTGTNYIRLYVTSGVVSVWLSTTNNQDSSFTRLMDNVYTFAQGQAAYIIAQGDIPAYGFNLSNP